MNAEQLRDNVSPIQELRQNVEAHIPHLVMGPPHDINNAPEVLSWYDNHNPDPGTTRLIHWLAAKVLKPEVRYEGYAEEYIEHHLEEGKTIYWMPDHTAIIDPVHLASAAKREKALNLLMGNTKIASKPGNFKLKPIRYLIDSFGAFVVFRSEDKDFVPGEAHEGEVVSPKAIATKATEELIVNTPRKGQNLVWYIEGTRGTHKPRSKKEKLKHLVGKLMGKPDDPERDFSELLPIKSTLSRAAATMSEEERKDTVFVPTSVYYGKKRRLKDFFRPIMYIGMPFDIKGEADEIKQDQKRYLQECRTEAIRLHEQRDIHEADLAV